MKVENKDRRYAMLSVNNSKIGNVKYFNKIYDELENLDVLKSAFDYFAEYTINVDIRIPINTEYKKKQTIANLPSPILFLKEIIESKEYDDLTKKGEYIIKGKEFYEMYVKYCSESGVSSKCGRTSFYSTMEKINIISKRIKRNKKIFRGVRFTAEEAENSFKKYLGDDNFKFDV